MTQINIAMSSVIKLSSVSCLRLHFVDVTRRQYRRHLALWYCCRHGRKLLRNMKSSRTYVEHWQA